MVLRMDEETEDAGLKPEYDLIVLGTGLVESIVACAASRCGKSVLHLDKNNFYGRECTSSPLDQFLSRCRGGYEGSLTCELEVVEPPSGAGNARGGAGMHGLQQLGFAELAEQVKMHHRVIDFQDMAEESMVPAMLGAPSGYKDLSHRQGHPSCYSYVMDRAPTAPSSYSTSYNSSTCHPAFFGYIQHNDMTARRAWLKSRFFNIDGASRLLLGSSISVETMIASGVSKYLEFKSIEGVFYINGPDDNYTVPCTKSDIFSTKLLNALEKRALMKFLQSVVDWGQSRDGHEVTTLNERELAQGRALKRPQNKDASCAVAAKMAGSSNQEDGDTMQGSFHAHMTAMKVPQRLQNIIVHALCLHGEGFAGQDEQGEGFLGTSQALHFLHQHMNALGKFGDTAFLAILYGSAELPQAFCRMCAVWGGTYVLRRTIAKVTLGPAFMTGSESESTEAGAGTSAGQELSCSVHSVQDSCGAVYKCGAFVCNIEDWPLKNKSAQTYYFVVSRIAIVDAPILSLSRCVGIVAPWTPGIDNVRAIYIVQMDSSVAVAPEGALVVHMETTVSLDAAALESADLGENPWKTIMNHYPLVQEAANLMNKTKNFFQNKMPFSELCYATSIRPLYNANNATVLPDGRTLTNMAVCGETRQSIHSNDCFEEAKSIFTALFPHDPFFPGRDKRAQDDHGYEEDSASDFDEDDSALESALSSLHPTMKGGGMESNRIHDDAEISRQQK